MNNEAPADTEKSQIKPEFSNLNKKCVQYALMRNHPLGAHPKEIVLRKGSPSDARIQAWSGIPRAVPNTAAFVPVDCCPSYPTEIGC